jgi:diazepam-binding inhibitor (GABA receptor modulating acyl-CoA-binding protein)
MGRDATGAVAVAALGAAYLGWQAWRQSRLLPVPAADAYEKVSDTAIPASEDAAQEAVTTETDFATPSEPAAPTDRSVRDSFVAATEAAKTLSNTTNEQKGQLYGLYKQATVGAAPSAAPSRFNLLAFKKWEAWDGVRTLSKREAMSSYCALVSSLRGEALDPMTQEAPTRAAPQDANTSLDDQALMSAPSSAAVTHDTPLATTQSLTPLPASTIQGLSTSAVANAMPSSLVARWQLLPVHVLIVLILLVSAGFAGILQFGRAPSGHGMSGTCVEGIDRSVATLRDEYEQYSNNLAKVQARLKADLLELERVQTQLSLARGEPARAAGSNVPTGFGAGNEGGRHRRRGPVR